MQRTRSIIAVSLLVASLGIIFAAIGSAYAQTYTTNTTSTATNSSGNTTKATNQTNSTAGGGMASKIPVIGPALNKVPGLNKIPGLGGK
jgi:hypothetical protein